MSQKNLTEELIGSGVLKNPLIIRAFYNIDRKNFVRPDEIAEAYLNQPLPIGHGQTISQPWTVAFMLELLEPQPGQKILDIGYGSGWQTALLSYIVSHDDKGEELPVVERGQVIALEIISAIADFGRGNLARYGFIKKKITQLHCLNAIHGLADEAPFDRIIAAAAGDKIPAEWNDQLKEGGRLVAPTGSKIRLVKKIGSDNFEQKDYEGFVFVPLVN